MTEPQSSQAIKQKEESTALDPEKPTSESIEPNSQALEDDQEDSEEITKEIKAALGDQATEDLDSDLLLAPGDTTITFSTIMPVAYSANDIRVLSFDVDVELETGKSAKLVRKGTPVFEKIMVQTVEKFLSEKMKKEKKFYNDILYIREKLEKRLTIAFNENLKGGRVRKVKFQEFLVQ